MIHTNELVAAVLFSVGATLAGTELFCRFTAKYNDKWYMMALAVLVPVVLVIIGVYFQIFAKPVKPVETTLIPQPKPAPPAHDVWKKMNNTRWVDSDGTQLFMQGSLSLFQSSNRTAPVSSGTLNKMRFMEIDESGDESDIGTFSSDFTKFTFAPTPNQTSETSPVVLTCADPVQQWNQFTWTSNLSNDQQFYSFERSWVLSVYGTVIQGELFQTNFFGNDAEGIGAFSGNFSDDLKTFTLNDVVYTFQGYQM